MSKNIVIVTDNNFKQEVIDSELPVFIDFWAAWCGPCRMVAPVVEQLADEFAGKLKVAKVDVDANPNLAGAFGIMSIPTMVVIKDGKIVDQMVGYMPKNVLANRLRQHVA